MILVMDQGHDGHCHLGTLGQVHHGDQCYCHDHGTNHEGAGCLVNWHTKLRLQNKKLIYDDSFDTFVKYVPKIMIGHRNGFAFSQDKGPTFQRVKVSYRVFYWNSCD